MSGDTTLVILTVFVAVTAAAFVVQALAALRMARTTQQIKDRVDAFLPKAERLLESADAAINDGRTQMTQITTRANEILALTHTQVQRVDELLADASVRAKVRMEQAETVLDNTLTRVNDTVNTVQGTILRPIREISGVAAGLRAVVGHLMKGAPANVAQVTTDEEMFI